MNKEIVIHWFRQDLRTHDNPAVCNAAEQGILLPIFILDDVNAGEYSLGAASRWWLHHSLKSLNQSLDNRLSIFMGDPENIILDLIRVNNVKAVYWNRCYEPWSIHRDKKIKNAIEAQGVEVKTFNGSLLWEPWDVLKKDKTPYKVFTPYYRRGCLNTAEPRRPLGKPKKLILPQENFSKLTIDDLGLLPKIEWFRSLENDWNIGESEARKKLDDFSFGGLENYKRGRDFPALDSVSRLSPHLHFGEVSPNEVWYSIQDNEQSDDIDHFLSEMGWREFSYHLLYHFPDLPRKNLQTKFDNFPWLDNTEHLRAWQRGETGHPLVDAGMRELWQTGYMHNRVRMVVGSFLVKNLLLHWHHGEQWFWDCLLDADLANNSAGWQWIAGCGADAAPYFRVFNPCTQGQKFDPHGDYTKRFVPELNKMPDKYLYCPWEAPDDVLKEAGVILGKTYPKPIIDLKTSRVKALSAYQSMKESNY